MTVYAKTVKYLYRGHLCGFGNYYRASIFARLLYHRGHCKRGGTVVKPVK